MSSPVNTQFLALTFTNNNLVNAINFLKNKNIIALYAQDVFRVFYAFPKNNIDKINIEDVRVIYIDCNSAKNILDKDEWDFFFQNAFKNRLQEFSNADEVGRAVFEQKTICHKEYITLIQKPT